METETLEVAATSCVSKPIALIIKVALFFTLIVKTPAELAVTPFLVPFSFTEAFGIGKPVASVTLPVTSVVCAYAVLVIQNIRIRLSPISFLMICSFVK